MWSSGHHDPSAIAGWVQAPPEQRSSVQELSSSVHESELNVWLHVKSLQVPGVQMSFVHGFPSSHAGVVTHALFTQLAFKHTPPQHSP
jgi:hypothetical protein